MQINKKVRIIAYYLPQYHPIPENDQWWGKGFTEWTNVAKAKPLFRGHYQPRIPADLGFYDLRMAETREAQALLAKKAGIEGFCYWHYWFGKGKLLLEKPFQDVLTSGKHDFPFCLAWANHDWTTKTWDKGKKFKGSSLIMKVHYSIEDYKVHFHYVLSAFKDERYLKVNGKPIFLIYSPNEIPNLMEFFATWNELALKNGLLGIYFISIAQNILFRDTDGSIRKPDPKNDPGKIYKSLLNKGFDAVNSRGYLRAQLLSKGYISGLFHKIDKKIFKGLFVEKYNYKEIVKNMFVEADKLTKVYPTIMPNFDRSPRGGKLATIWYNSKPEIFKKHLNDALNIVSEKDEENRIVFLQSWNEWAEGNYVEPDLLYGHA